MVGQLLVRPPDVVCSSNLRRLYENDIRCSTTVLGLSSFCSLSCINGFYSFWLLISSRHATLFCCKLQAARIALILVSVRSATVAPNRATYHCFVFPCWCRIHHLHSRVHYRKSQPMSLLCYCYLLRWDIVVQWKDPQYWKYGHPEVISIKLSLQNHPYDGPS